MTIKRTRVLLVVVLGLLIGAAVTGCAQTQEGGERGLKEEGALTFAMSGLYKPYNYKHDARLTGFDAEIGRALANEMGLKPQPVTNPFETIVAGLQAKKYDAIIGSMGITPEREKGVLFTRPYYLSGAQIFVNKGNDSIRDPDDLTGKRIGVVIATTYKEEAAKYSEDLKSYTSDVVALQDLPTGRVDAVITDEGIGDFAIKNGLPIQKVGKPLTNDRMGIAVNKNNPELAKEINRALDRLIQNGTYERISEKWFGRNILEKQ